MKSAHHEGVRASECIATRIFRPGIRWGSDQIHAPAALSSWTYPVVPIE
jgi:hypothetical protein